ncbi:sugar kinase [Alicyclobacillus cellulosilyticus]|uniref:Sugar kinase n=1 Tax=Alicyclobacillus cellulosilyticus TaxID=1003997 RepID=A0A917K5A9_9BACL|nr:ROK family transcriptional regulator [Alicyclobacillus cellulosilyticus]GGJ00572.1 sugar kinase [Alicyclobacillus cellulosilyticus]
MKVLPTVLRKVNERRVLNVIRMRGRVSRPEIGMETGLTQPTVIRIVDALLEQGWLREVGYAESSMGRPPKLVEVNPHTPVAVGVELGRLRVRVAFVNLLGEIRQYHEVDADEIDGVRALVEHVARWIEAYGYRMEDVIGVGLAAPSFPNSDEFRDWHQEPVVDAIESELGMTAWLENDANAAVLGEMWFGLGQEARHLVFVLSEIGVGAGIAVNGSIYKGDHDAAGEFSRTIVTFEDGEPKTLASSGDAVAILNAVRAAKGLTLSRGHPEPSLLEAVIRRAKEGLAPEADIVRRALDFMAAGIINLVHVIDPSMVILGGHTFFADPFMVEETQRRIEAWMPARRIPIVVTQFGSRAVAVGAATLVLQHVYDHTQVIG